MTVFIPYIQDLIRWYNEFMLVDDITLKIKAGSGGNGSSSFRATTGTPKTPSDGGNGGDGGDIYVQGSSNVSDLSQFRYQKSVNGENGTNGGHKNLFGKRGKSITILLPLGTSLEDVNTGEIWEVDSTQPQLIAKGGRGGLGNKQFHPTLNRMSTYSPLGHSGEERELHLVLKLIAKIGLVGLPNAGKSSLLKVLTNATPKIGAYPFTTLEPNLGVYKKLVIADIPGLIDGASDGKGLGLQFLKHIEKTEILVHLIDSTQDDILSVYETVRNEFKNYSDTLLEKEELIVLSKVDLLEKEELDKKIKILKGLGKKFTTLTIYDEKSVEAFGALLEKSYPSLF